MSLPPLLPPDPRRHHSQQQIHRMDASDARHSGGSWADEMDVEDHLQSQSTEDELMDAWIEATRHTGSDGNVILSPIVVKLVTALLRKVTTVLKDACKAHHRVDRLEVRMAELASKPHPLPPRPMSWAAAAKQKPTQETARIQTNDRPPPPPSPKVINEFKTSALVIRRVPDQTPFEGMTAAQIIQSMNLALETIGAELTRQPICISMVAVLRPSGDIKMHTTTRHDMR
ncbi:hypothetical protein CROQUDRAFT_664460 [Cronartium quercuum f. sp. fusiforme G11]|uniref:Uncharacterized protein n=1 Tax=Cronartium quercuum f. sp. fusiforme G11 TaxID=708437 RepID=A0A9P6NBV5_9BASI|nr:hypothetical protein CROQUDRAFT_664460 [Cronartium quercuum f. sp. fusiforme G11]